VNVQGGRERGLLLHKLIEEVLTGETEETEKALCERAKTLIPALGCSINDQALGLSPTELANSVLRALAIPEVAALRPRLMPEFPVYSVAMNLDQEEVIAGFADAIAFDPSGVPQIVVDWKSDVAPSAETIEHYRSQVRTYLDTTGAERGLIVLMTLGTVIPVTRRQIQAPR
jgi:exodeoxyribonuclease-5